MADQVASGASLPSRSIPPKNVLRIKPQTKLGDFTIRHQRQDSAQLLLSQGESYKPIADAWLDNRRIQ